MQEVCGWPSELDPLSTYQTFTAAERRLKGRRSTTGKGLSA